MRGDANGYPHQRVGEAPDERMGQVVVLRNELQELARSLDEKDLVSLVAQARQLASTRDGCPAIHATLRPRDQARVEIDYVGLSPFWPAFEDINYVPEVRCIDKNTGTRMKLPQGLRFRIAPDPPAAVTFDTFTGAFKGSAVLSHCTGAQYQVTAFTKDDGELGCCAVTFAVLPPELAALYNDAFQAQEAPAWQESCAKQTGIKKNVVQVFVDSSVVQTERRVVSPHGSADFPGLISESPPSSPARPASAFALGRSTVRPLGKPLSSRVAQDVPSWFGAGVPMIKGPPPLRTRPSTAACVMSYSAERPRYAVPTTYNMPTRPASSMM